MQADKITEISAGLRGRMVDVIVEAIHDNVTCPVQALKTIMRIATDFDDMAQFERDAEKGDPDTAPHTAEEVL